MKAQVTLIEFSAMIDSAGERKGPWIVMQFMNCGYSVQELGETPRLQQ